MIIRHKILKDFQLLTSDKKIIILKTGSLLEGYKYTTKNDSVKLDRDIVESNPDYFLLLDCKVELVNVMKAAKIQTPAIIAKKIMPFLEEILLSSSGGTADNSQEREELEQEYREKLRAVKDKEISLDAELTRVARREKEIEVDLEEAEKRIRKRQLEIDEISNGIDKLTQAKERELEIKYQKLENDLRSEWQEKVNELSRKENLLAQRVLEIETKEGDNLRKLKDIQGKEEKLREFEASLNSKEMNIESIIMDSQKNLDQKQKEMMQNVKNSMKELQEKESGYNQKMDELEEREKNILQSEEEFVGKIRQLEVLISQKNEELEAKKVEISQREEELSQKNIDAIVEQALTNFEKKIPWQYHRKK